MDCFYDRVERDDLLAPRFFPDGVNEAHRAHVTAWWTEVLGGPARYTEELGGYEGMLAHHRGLPARCLVRSRARRALVADAQSQRQKVGTSRHRDPPLWLCRGAIRPEDQIIDLMIAAEAVFLPGEQGESAHKLSLRAGLLLHREG